MSAHTTAQDTTQQIHTARLLLRPPVAGDAGAIAALADNWRVVRNTARMPFPYLPEHARDWIDSLEDEHARGAANFAVTLAAPPHPLIGICSYGPPDGTHGKGFGYWYGEPYWGLGYATEAGSAVLDHLFDTHARVVDVAADFHTANDASGAVLKKLGFRIIGESQGFSRARDANVPLALVLLRRAERAAKVTAFTGNA
jgi:RimJ/RimL family protein N-acetyltransferase